MNKLDTKRRVQVVAALVEGNSIRSTSRMTGVAKGTILKLLVELGDACERYQDVTIRNIKTKRIQCDEIWSFVYGKTKNISAEKRAAGGGEAWTWTALDADTKLMISWAVGGRDPYTANAFMHDLKDRLANRVQLTTDGHNLYINAVEGAFGSEIDYAMLVKVYGPDTAGARQSQARYSPAPCVGAEKKRIAGNPAWRNISTSYVERANLTMRMNMRRFTRLTNGFSKKVDNLKAAVALHFMHYNFCRIHQTLRVTPAMEAGISTHVWELEEVIALLDAPRPE